MQDAAHTSIADITAAATATARALRAERITNATTEWKTAPTQQDYSSTYVGREDIQKLSEVEVCCHVASKRKAIQFIIFASFQVVVVGINAAIKGITATHECAEAQLAVDKVKDLSVRIGDKVRAVNTRCLISNCS